MQGHLRLQAYRTKSSKKICGFTTLEVLVAGMLFAIVILGLSQAVLAANRYARANLCRTHAHLVAMSYFEQLIGNTHPYDLYSEDLTKTKTTDKFETINLVDLKTLTQKPFKYNIVNGANFDFDTTNKFYATIYNVENDLEIHMKLVVKSSPLYEDYGDPRSPTYRQNVNPPIGFQSLHLTYRWNAPTASDASNPSTWPSSQLYAIRPLNVDDPEDAL